MQNLQVNLDDSVVHIDYIEYFVIGAQAMVWLIGIGAYCLGIPVALLLSAPLILLLPALAFMYIVGIAIDSFTQFILTPVRNVIKARQLGDVDCTDEFIGLYSPVLYHTYEWRIRRTRIPGSAWLNWLLIAVAAILQMGWSNSNADWAVISASAVAVALTLFSWYLLNRRAYRFRRNACLAIQARTALDVQRVQVETRVFSQETMPPLG